MPSIVIDNDSMGRETNITDAAGTTAVLYDSCGAVANETVTGALGTKSISRSDYYGYNDRDGFISAAKNAEYQYTYDEIGNRRTFVELDTGFF